MYKKTKRGVIVKQKGFMFISFILWMCIITSFSVLAGDVPESALQSADYCFIGEVQNIENSYVAVKIYEVVFGEFSEDIIKINDLKYTDAPGKLSLPKVGDYCAAVVIKSNDEYIVYDGLAAKSNSLDRETLKLKSSHDFLKRMNEYINNGHYSNQTIENFNYKINKSRESVNSSAPSSPIDNKAINIENGIEVNNPKATDQNSSFFEGININIGFGAVVMLVLIMCIFVIIKKAKRKI